MVHKRKVKIEGIGPKLIMQDVGVCGNTNNKEFSWIIVCDGIGGMPNGEVAANITMNTVNRFLKSQLKNDSQLNNESFFKNIIESVQLALTSQVNKSKVDENMGCTLCVVIFLNNGAYVFWSGDSRFYLFRNEECFWDTLPHSWVFDLYRKGILTLDEARFSETNYLTGSVNVFTNEIRFDTHKLQLQKGDRLLICTDGIWGLFEHKDLIKEFTKKSFDDIKKNFPRYLQEYANDNYFGYIVDI